MKTGVIISGIVHAVVLLVLLIGPFAFVPEPTDILPVTEVSLLSSAQFDAVTSTEPQPPMTDMSPITAPSSETNDTATPHTDAAPTETAKDVTAPPSAQDANPDLSALARVAQPSVPVAAPQPFVPAPAQDSPVAGIGTAGNAPGAVLSAPHIPRAAPRIDTVAAPPVPDAARTSDRTVAATAPDPAATDAARPEVPAQAVPESVTQIQPEAQPNVAPSAAPPRASVPVRRPANAAANAEAIAAKVRAREEAAIQDLLQQAVGDTPAPAAPATAPAAQPAVSLSGAQKRGIGAAIAKNWNKSIVLGKENYEQLVVRIAVNVGADGTILGGVEPVEPKNPTGDFAVAYEAARRAVLRAGKIPLPAGDFPDGVRLILRFDPMLGIGLN